MSRSSLAALLPVPLPPGYGYIAAFLTLRCNNRCPYCINRYAGDYRPGPEMSAEQWVAGLNRLDGPPDLPVTLQGGEPSLHAGFCEIIAGLRDDLRIDILTNLKFDIEEFMRRIPPSRIRRDAPYASIRVSYHPGQEDLATILAKASRLQQHGYSIGIWMVNHPDQADAIESARQACRSAGIDFRLKEFLGRRGGRLYGTYRYPSALAGKTNGSVLCKTTELIIGPDGSIHRCHSDLYASRQPIGDLLDASFSIQDVYRQCDNFGLCNPCDVKIKTNRFQEFGHTSVSIMPRERHPGDDCFPT